MMLSSDETQLTKGYIKVSDLSELPPDCDGPHDVRHEARVLADEAKRLYYRLLAQRQQEYLQLPISPINGLPYATTVEEVILFCRVCQMEWLLCKSLERYQRRLALAYGPNKPEDA